MKYLYNHSSLIKLPSDGGSEAGLPVLGGTTTGTTNTKELYIKFYWTQRMLYMQLIVQKNSTLH